MSIRGNDLILRHAKSKALLKNILRARCRRNDHRVINLFPQGLRWRKNRQPK